MNLSPLDIKLLRYTKFNGMAPTKELAQKLRVSPATIDYKLKKLEDENVITEYKYRLDYRRLGLNKLAWVFLIANYRKGSSLKEISSSLLSNPSVHMLLMLTGGHDIGLKIYAKDFHDISDLTFKIRSQLGDTIRSVNTVFAMKTYKLNQVPLEECKKSANLDSSDIRILDYLLRSPRARIKEIASSLKIHRNTVSSKLRRLHDEKIIIKKSPVINTDYHQVLGIAFKSVVFINTETDCIEELAKKLATCEMVHELFAINTNHDIMAIIRTDTIRGLKRFHDMLYSDAEYKKLVYDTETLCVLDVLGDRSDDPPCLTPLKK
ncbi:MAG: Lrp/AsnC family transcriptional regulator [Candidatus Aenigmatarchaeota archaeon]